MPDMDISEEAPPYQIAGILGERGAPPPTGSSSGGGGGGVTGVQTSSKRPRDDGSPVCGKRGRGENGDISLSLKMPMPGPPLQVSSPSVDSERCRSFPETPAYCPTSPAYSPNSPAYSPSDLVCSRPDSPDSPICSANSPPCSPALCESPKINQTPASPAPFSGGAAAKSSAVTSGGTPSTPAAIPSAIAAAGSTACAAVQRRKARVPHAAPPSLGATDPIFHAALLRVLHGRGGDHCAEAVGWRWKGDAPARFDHWPCALHPSVMDLLACVSASEEEVVMTGCDKKHLGGCGRGGGGNDDGDDDENPPPPREAAWRAPRPRTPWPHRGGPAAAASTPSPAPSTRPTQTPLSALRKPGSACRLSSKNRVRFSTHDMSVVDTPDPQRGGSERGMISALGGLESILAAAERVRNLAAPRGGGGGSATPYGRGTGPMAASGPGDQQYEGYFDRFSATVGEPAEDVGDDRATAAEEREAPASNNPVTDDSTAAVSEAPGSDAGNESLAAAAAKEDDDDVDASLTTEAKSVREDLAKFVAVLDEIASSDAAPEEITLEGGWGPEHSNAAAFYAKELGLLCGGRTESTGDVAEAASLALGGSGAGVIGSHLRVRYLDVLSCLVRYNLKLLLNVCECEPPDEGGDGMEHENQEEEGHEPSHVEAGHEDDGSNNNNEDDDDDDDDRGQTDASDDENENDQSGLTSNLPAASTPSATAALTVVVPGRAVPLPEPVQQDNDNNTNNMAWGCPAPPAQLCGCVSVLDDKGALEFNTEDVAALLTLALGRVHPFMPLAARITVAAEAAGWDGGCGDETLDERVWASVQEYTLENRAAAAAAAGDATAGAATAASRTQLFSSPAGAMSPPPPVLGGGRSVAKFAGRAIGGAAAAESSPSTEESAAPDDEANTEAEASNNASAPAAADSPALSITPLCGAPAPENDGSTATGVAAVELTADEAADLLEFVAAARFIAQLLAEPVVASGISAGRWSCAMRLSEQVRKLAEEEQEAQEAATAAAASAGSGIAPTAAKSSLSNMLCLGALADVQGLGMMMAQQARYAPALEAALKRELRQALRRGQGLKRRIRHRLQPQHQHQQGGGGAPDVFSFPMVTPACQLLHLEGGGLMCD